MAPAAAAVRWQLPAPVAVDRLVPRVPPPVAQFLIRRGIDTPQKLDAFLNPPHRLPYDPLRLSGMDTAVRRLYKAVNAKERVGIFGDFDVDGITGTAIIAEGLSALSVAVTPYLPHRVDEGHGLSRAAVDQLVGEGVSLIITVDTGITAFDEVAYAKARGADVIITDHHLPHEGLPDAIASLNPKLPGGTYPFFDLCGAGLGFKLIQGLFDFYGQPWNPNLLELAALGTISDLVPMLDENRYLVSEGIRLMSKTERPGLHALYSSARVLPEEIDSDTISFQIAPRINAAGRMGNPIDSYRLLTTNSHEEAKALTQKLEAMNLERREATQQAYELACERVEAMAYLPAMLVVADETIPRGVAGLVAGRLSERFRRPAVVMAVEQEFAVGSARSIPEFNIADAISASQDLLVRFGGHSQAAGFTVARQSIPELTTRLDAYTAEILESDDLAPVLDIDAVVSLADLTPEVMDWISTLAPYGPENRRPLFASIGVAVRECRVIGYMQQHLRLLVEQDGVAVVALAFNQAQFRDPEVSRLDLAYTLFYDSWQGNKTLALRVSQFRPAQTPGN